jgi:PAS domain S-box-containing protein/diguanylate cyclase (GGDEF)-like protein
MPAPAPTRPAAEQLPLSGAHAATPLRILIIEDSDDDARLLLREIRHGGFVPTSERVETHEAMQQALATQPWDVITCDYMMPRFSVPAALATLREAGHDLPFIVVSGRIGEEATVQALKAGAHHVVMKDKLAELVPVIERELQAAEERRQYQLAQKRLRESEAQLRTLARVSPVGIFQRDTAGNCLYVNQSYTQIAGLSRDQALGRGWIEAIHHDDRHRLLEAWRRCVSERGSFELECRYRRPDGCVTWVLERADGEVGATSYVGTVTDITDLKVVESRLRERVKEQRCLHLVSSLANRLDLAEELFLDQAVALLPPAFQHPDIAGARIRLNGRVHQTPGFRETPWVLASELRIGEERVGAVEVSYSEPPPGADEEVFLNEEDDLLDAVAAILSRAIASRKAAAELQAREHDLREAQHIAGLGSWTWEIDRDRVTWSDELYRIFARDPAQPAPRVAEQAALYSADSWAALSAALERTRITGDDFELDLELVTAGGKRWMSARGTALRDAAGQITRLQGTGLDITARKQAQQALARSERRFRALIENASDLVIVIDRAGRIAYASPSLGRIGGYDPAAVTGQPFADFVHPDDRAESAQDLQSLIQRPDRLLVSERRYRRRDGTWIYLNARSRNALDDPAIRGIVVNARDVTGRRQAETELRILNRNLATLSACNEALVRAGDEAQLLQAMCDITVDTGGYRMAWIGYPAAIAHEPVRIMARAGEGADSYLENIRVTQDESRHGRGPTGTALRTGTPQIIQDIREDPRFEPWRPTAERHGYRAVAAIPLHTSGGDCLGTLNIYAGEAGVFTADAVELLQRLAGDLAFGIGTLRDREERRRIETRLELANTVVENSPTMLFRWRAEPDWPIEYVSENIAQFGYRAEEFLSGELAYARIIHPDDLQRVAAEMTRHAASDVAHFTQEYRIVTRSGEVRWVDDRTAVERDPAGRVIHFQGTVMDVTERKLQALKIARLNRIYEVLSGINSLIVRVHERQELFDEACRIAARQGGFAIAWIGWIEGASTRIDPVAAMGRHAADYLRGLDFTIDGANSGGRTAIGTAVRTRSPSIHNAIDHDPEFVNRDRALAFGIHAAAFMPLIVADEVQGVLALYADEAGFFDHEELALLEELSGDISFALDHIAKEEQVNYLAFYDVLTGLPNRVFFIERLDQELLQLDRNGAIAAVVLADLERFRSIVDTLGRHCGDTLLKLVAERLQQTVGATTQLARIEADRFALFFRGIENPADVAHHVVEAIDACFSAPFTVDQHELSLAARLGIALFPDNGHDADSLIKNAEVALYKAKATTEHYLFYEHAMHARVAETLLLESRLRDAVKKEQFVLHYQPKIDARTRAIVGFEALIRWNDPETGGLVPPGMFIPILEETGLILQVGQWVMRQARHDFRAWVELGLDPPRVAVNVSAIQLQQAGFVADVRAALVPDEDGDHGIDVEITESIIMANVEENIAKLTTIRQLGARISIDDFGTGYSSLSYIAKLPLDTLKIDRSFVIRMAHSADDMSIVRSIISLGHDLELKIVAEGVETEEQAHLLLLLRCDQMQGFLFSKPVPAEAVPELLARAPD